MSIKAIKVISTVLTLAGVVINLATSSLGEKLLEHKIQSKISEALSENL